MSKRVRIEGDLYHKRIPAGAVSVAHPSKFRNPYRPSRRTPEANAVACSPELSCHVDVLLELLA